MTERIQPVPQDPALEPGGEADGFGSDRDVAFDSAQDADDTRFGAGALRDQRGLQRRAAVADDEPLAQRPERVRRPPQAEPEDDSELESDHPESSAKEWLMLIGLVVAGVCGGAGAWLGFNWLWGMHPIIAVVLALLVVGGIVFLARKIGRGGSSVVPAIVVGLIVVVSPAVLLAFRH